MKGEAPNECWGENHQKLGAFIRQCEQNFCIGGCTRDGTRVAYSKLSTPGKFSTARFGTVNGNFSIPENTELENSAQSSSAASASMTARYHHIKPAAVVRTAAEDGGSRPGKQMRVQNLLNVILLFQGPR